MFKFAIIYFICINFVGIMLNIIDKHKAKKNRWRIPEKSLWTCALLGGACGEYATMKIIRHKTKHKSFMLGMPVLAFIDIIALIFICINFYTGG